MKRKFLFTTLFWFVLPICQGQSTKFLPQSDKWTQYISIKSKIFNNNLSGCERLGLYNQLDSLYERNLNLYVDDFEHMVYALICGDTAKAKEMAYKVVRWKCWNAGIFEYNTGYGLFKQSDYWPELDSLSQIYGGLKDYDYMGALNRMGERDQAIRYALNDTTLTSQQQDSLSVVMHIVDSINQDSLAMLIEERGFPTWELTAYSASNNAFLIIQHAPLPFRYRYMKVFRESVADSNAEISNYAYIEDRTRSDRGLPQLYGTQLCNPGLGNDKMHYFYPIADIKNINRRREEAHLEPLEQYIGGYLNNYSKAAIANFDTLIVYSGFIDYHNNYYHSGFYDWMDSGSVEAYQLAASKDFSNAIDIYYAIFSELNPFVQDLEVYLKCLLSSDYCGNKIYNLISPYEAVERMVLCGRKIEDFPSWIPDTLLQHVKTVYPELRSSYLSQLNNEDNTAFESALQNKDSFLALLGNGKNYPRYEIDAWNKAYSKLQKMTDELQRNNYKEFFEALKKEVQKGNLHPEDFATLFDRTHYRLYHKDYYGTLSVHNKKVKTEDAVHLDSRRQEAELPPLWAYCDLNNLTYPKGYKSK